jgi:DNA (cytosine-5)-methyltransferase 1
MNDIEVHQTDEGRWYWTLDGQRVTDKTYGEKRDARRGGERHLKNFGVLGTTPAVAPSDATEPANKKGPIKPKLRVGSLFSGAGGLDLGVCDVFDAETVWVCEINKDPSKVLAARFPHAPNLGDITKVDWAQGLYDDGTQDGGNLEPVDILIGGFPCQDVSSAGLRAGIKDGTRSGLWAQFAVAIDALRPKFVVIENVRGLLSATADRGLESDSEDLGVDADECLLRAAGAVLGDLASLGYDARWCTVPACWWGAPHERMRVFILAHPRDIDPEFITASLRSDGGATGPLVDIGELLPTPDAGVFTRGSKHMMTPAIVRAAVGDPTLPNPELAGAPVALLPTPTTEPTTGNGHARNLGAEIKGSVTLLPTPKANDDLGTRNMSPDYGPTLTDAALYAVGDDRSCLLPTPLADGAARRGGDRSDEPLLPDVVREAVRLLPTPRAADGKGGAGRHGEGGLLRTAMDEAVKLFPTPTASSGGRTGQHPDVRRGYGIGASIVEMVDVAVAFGEPEWHQYDAAIQRWSAIFRPAPYPVVAGKGGKPQLCARFEEWMMGWPLNWVNVKGLSRRAQLRICGNGVVPQQAAGALRIMLAELIAELTAA